MFIFITKTINYIIIYRKKLKYFLKKYKISIFVIFKNQYDRHLQDL